LILKNTKSFIDLTMLKRIIGGTGQGMIHGGKDPYFDGLLEG
jgi:hypothetical protein